MHPETGKANKHRFDICNLKLKVINSKIGVVSVGAAFSRD
jgi:hypothetical protein